MKDVDIIKLLGLTSDNEKVVDFLVKYGINKNPMLKHGEENAYLENILLGIEITFKDERFLDIKRDEYEEGALVLSNVRMYGPYKDNGDFSRFDEAKLPFGLKYDFDLKEVVSKLKKQPAFVNKSVGIARWDLKDFCLFVTFDKKMQKIRIVAIQLPVA